MEKRIIAALDVPTQAEALELVSQLTGEIEMFKVGMELFYACGGSIVQEIRARGGKVFLDLKLHDIPNTVARSAAVIARLGANIINVHAAGGLDMMQRAAEEARESAAKANLPLPRIIAVTVLTSINQEVFQQEVGFAGAILGKVVNWAELAKKAGLDGVVSSPWEIEAVRQSCGSDFLIVTPGVRPLGAALGDQKRVMTPEDAVSKGASYVVIGRPITQAANPAEAAQQIAAALSEI
ncbi:MAG: orotidine-5'-phosphate decarboxylase [Clostridia bacterium]|nr:orotidine-5'-phosphate decarboxylase [Clostridia bacterium]